MENNFRLIFKPRTNTNLGKKQFPIKKIKTWRKDNITILNKKFKEKKLSTKWVPIEINYWNPEVGDKIEGRLVQIITNDSQKLYVIKQDDGKRIKIWGKSYLNQLMDEVEINDYIRITYNGFKKTYNNRQMKRYNLERRQNNE